MLPVARLCKQAGVPLLVARSMHAAVAALKVCWTRVRGQIPTVVHCAIC
jgi:hypothetical protein